MNRFAAYAVVTPLAASLTLYVAGYYPPEKQSEKPPGHEHIHQNSGTTQAAVTGHLVLGASTSVLPGTTWPVGRW
jgi:hypothetical protein